MWFLQSNLNPKEFYCISSLCSCRSFYTDVVCCLQFHCNCWDFSFIVSAWHLAECTSGVFVNDTQTRTVLKGHEWVMSLLVLSFPSSSSYCVLFSSQRCGLCNTAYCNLCRPRIVALYFLSVCKCTGGNDLYFSNVVSLIWGKTVLQLPDYHTCKWEFDFYFLIWRHWR